MHLSRLNWSLKNYFVVEIGCCHARTVVSTSAVMTHRFSKISTFIRIAFTSPSWCGRWMFAFVSKAVRPFSTSSLPLWHAALSIRHRVCQFTVNCDGGDVSPIKAESHCELLPGTSFPVSFPLHINLSLVLHLADTWAVPCYSYHKRCLQPQNKALD